MSERLVGTESAAGAIARVKYSHDAMIDLIIANPAVSQNQIAAHFGYSVPWVSRVMNSDAFLTRLAVRKSDLVDPIITFSLEEKFKALADKSLDVVLEKLTVTGSAELGLKALEITAKALGYGARQQNLNVQQNFVVALPAKAESAESWAAAHNGGRQLTIDVPPAGAA